MPDRKIPGGNAREKNEPEISGPEAFTLSVEGGATAPEAMPLEADAVASPASRIHTASWIMYDLANTIFAGTVTFLLAPSIHAGWAGATNSSAMIFAALITPAVAAMADRTGRAGNYCAVATLICIGAMTMFGVFTSLPPLLAAFFIATVFYHSALVFYNSLLPSVAPENKMGLISGLGVGMGYLGTVFTLVIALPVQKHFGLQTAFFVTPVAFLICALPCMILVRDRRNTPREPTSIGLWFSQLGEIASTLRNLPRRPVLMWFLIANFFAVDVLNTAILFYGRFIHSSFVSMAEAGALTLFGHTISDIHRFHYDWWTCRKYSRPGLRTAAWLHGGPVGSISHLYNGGCLSGRRVVWGGGFRRMGAVAVPYFDLLFRWPWPGRDMDGWTQAAHATRAKGRSGKIFRTIWNYHKSIGNRFDSLRRDDRGVRPAHRHRQPGAASVYSIFRALYDAQFKSGS